jgi:hypothetical protein
MRVYLFLFLVVPVFSYAEMSGGIPSGFEIERLEEFERSLSEEKSQLRKFSRLYPDKEIEAVIFFKNERDLEGVVSSDYSEKFKVVGFRHGNKNYSGGYNLKDGESLSEAIESYRRDHIKFLQEDEKNMRIIADESDGDAQIKNAASARLRSIVGRQDDYIKNGLRIVGLEVKGKPKGLIDLWESGSHNVRAIKVKESQPIPNKFD